MFAQMIRNIYNWASHSMDSNDQGTQYHKKELNISVDYKTEMTAVQMSFNAKTEWTKNPENTHCSRCMKNDSPCDGNTKLCGTKNGGEETVDREM